MSSIRIDDSLEKKADQLRDKAKRAERATNVEERVENARNDIKRVTAGLSELEQSVRELQFYTGILTEVFDQSRLASVDGALEKARSAADVSEKRIVEDADEGDLMSLKDEIDTAKSSVKEAIAAVQNKIDTDIDRWRNDIDSARELDRIITGGESDFSQVLYNMDNFLSTDINDSSNNPSALANRWDRLKNSWDEHAGKHGWSAFKEQYDLSDSTVRKLQKFTDQNSVYLSEFTEKSLEEIKNVDELESAIKLQIDPK